MTAKDDPNTSLTALVVVVGALITLVLVVALQALYYRTHQRELERKVIGRPPAQLRQALAEQERKLDGYRWIDREAGVVAIPVERAVELFLDEHGEDGTRVEQ